MPSTPNSLLLPFSTQLWKAGLWAPFWSLFPHFHVQFISESYRVSKIYPELALLLTTSTHQSSPGHHLSPNLPQVSESPGHRSCSTASESRRARAKGF